MRKIRLVIGVVALVAFGAVSAHASGFAIVEQGVRGLGTAYAGAAALAEDPSTIFYNPAGMVRLTGIQIEAGAHYILPKAEYTDKGSTTVLTTPLTGGDGGDAGEGALVPNFYYAHQLSDAVVAGLGVHAPYGLATEYDRDWVGRYHTVESKLSTININPSVAVRMNEKWSVGAGVSIEYADATLSSKADWGTIGVGYGLLPPGQDQLHDGFTEVEGDDWAYGFNLGVLFEPTQDTRLGLAFRSKVDHKLEGTVKWEYETFPAEAIATGANAVNGNASAKVSLPETLSIAGYHALNDKLAVVADATFTNWDRLEELRIVYDTGQDDTVVTLDWESTWRFGLGLIYTATPKCTGRIGIAFDQSPIPNAEKRTPRIPDEDRFWVSVGGAYKFTEKLEFNLGYTHIFVDDPEVNKPATGEDRIRGALVGEWDASVDIVSVNMTYVF